MPKHADPLHGIYSLPYLMCLAGSLSLIFIVLDHTLTKSLTCCLTHFPQAYTARIGCAYTHTGLIKNNGCLLIPLYYLYQLQKMILQQHLQEEHLQGRKGKLQVQMVFSQKQRKLPHKRVKVSMKRSYTCNICTAVEEKR